MTKEELDNQVVEKKIAKMGADDKAAILKFVGDYLLSSELNYVASGTHLVNLGLIKVVKKFPIGITLNAKDGYFEITNFGKMIKKKLVDSGCPF